MWMKFRHEESGKQFWVGSAHLLKNETNDEYKRLATEVADALPAWDGPVVLLGDINVDFMWRQSDNEMLNVVRDPRKHVLQGVFGARGLVQVPPADRCLKRPTFVSRKSGVRPTRIDAVFARASSCGRVEIKEGSKTMTGSDHNQIFVDIGSDVRGAARLDVEVPGWLWRQSLLLILVRLTSRCCQQWLRRVPDGSPANLDFVLARLPARWEKLLGPPNSLMIGKGTKPT